MVLTNDETMSGKLKSLRTYGMKGTYYAEEHGYNLRKLDEVQAAILNFKIKHLDDWIKKRQHHLANQYQSMLADILTLPVEETNNYHAYYVYVVRHPNRDRIIESLGKGHLSQYQLPHGRYLSCVDILNSVTGICQLQNQL